MGTIDPECSFILGATYWIMLVQHGSYIKAVNYSTFATFIGALASYIYLIAYSRKRMRHYRELYHESVPVHDMHVLRSLKIFSKKLYRLSLLVQRSRSTNLSIS